MLSFKSTVIIKGGVPTVNGRTYPVSVLEEVWQDDDCSALGYGQFGKPSDDGTINAHLIGFKVTDLRMEEGNLVADIIVLDETPTGALMRVMTDSNVAIRFMPFGIGTFIDDVVQPGYKLIHVYAVEADKCD